MTDRKVDQAGLLPGTLDLLILKAVSLGKLHGYGVLLRIGQISGGALEIQLEVTLSTEQMRTAGLPPHTLSRGSADASG